MWYNTRAVGNFEQCLLWLPVAPLPSPDLFKERMEYIYSVIMAAVLSPLVILTQDGIEVEELEEERVQMPEVEEFYLAMAFDEI